MDGQELASSEQEVETIRALSAEAFCFAALRIEDWNEELTPWAAPPVFGKTPFGDGAGKTLAFITDQLLPVLHEKEIDTAHCLLGGYSLAGLFALWAGYRTSRFEGIAAVSPSVWFPGWVEYATQGKPFPGSVYLSLGDKEEKAKNPVVAQVGNAIRRQEEVLRGQGVNTILEWNAGNHFACVPERMAKGFAWLMNNRNVAVSPSRLSCGG